jgi:threonine dehydratase
MVTLKDIETAHRRIRDRIRRTPAIPFAPLRESLPNEVILKLECLQVTGSFKPRGALNKILSLEPERIARGIITASGGNHGLGVAYSAWLLGVPATVYVPEKANQARRDRLARWGATVIVHGRDWDDAYAAAVVESERTDRCLIHPFNDPLVIAGQGTVGTELLADSGRPLDAVVVPIGGGGLIAGVATAVKEQSPRTAVIGVEPTGAASMTASVQAQRLVELPQIRSIADTLSARCVGDLTLEATRRYVDRIALVEDEALCRAMPVLWNEFNLLVEPSGAAALAVLLEGKAELPPGARVGVIVSGGNIDAGPALAQFDPSANIVGAGTDQRR